MANNSYTKNYADGAALTEAKLDTAYQTLKLDISNTDVLSTGSTSGQVLTSNGSGSATSFQTIADPVGPSARNYGLSASTSSGALIVALKTNAGTNPTASDAVDITFSTSSTTSAFGTKFTQTASLTLTVTASATLGLATGTTGSIYVYAVRASSTTLRLAVSLNGGLDFGPKQTTVAMAASSDTAGILYSNASASTYPVRLLGTISASHTAGTWNNIYGVYLNHDGQRFYIETADNTTQTVTTTVYTDVTNLTLTFGASGKRYRFELQPAHSSLGILSYIEADDTGSSGDVSGLIAFVVDGTVVSEHRLVLSGPTNGSIGIPPGAYFLNYKPSTGSHTVKVQARVIGASDRIFIGRCKLAVTEH